MTAFHVFPSWQTVLAVMNLSDCFLSLFGLVPTRLEYAKVIPPKAEDLPIKTEDYSTRSWKRQKLSSARSKCRHTIEEVEHATLWLDTLLRQ